MACGALVNKGSGTLSDILQIADLPIELAICCVS